MKEKIAHLLVRLAKWLCPREEFALSNLHEPKKIGIGYHITKADVRKFRVDNPQYKSHRKALNAIVEDTKKEIIRNIVASIVKNDLIQYSVHKTLYVADVIGKLYVYAPQKETDGTGKE